LVAATFEKYPELVVFLVAGIGYRIGAFKIRGFGLGPVTGSLIVGLLSGALTESPAIGTATEAIETLPLPEAERARLVSHIAGRGCPVLPVRCVRRDHVL
jgi:putative transport protein